MDEKTLLLLEFPKVLERLACYCSFSGSADLARNLRPALELEEARRRLQLTREARLLLSINDDVRVGGAHDIRPLTERAARKGVLDPSDLLAIKDTLISARGLARSFERKTEQYPLLSELAAQLPPPPGLVDAISRAISDRGDILDQASPALARIRAEIKIAYERLMTRLQRLVNDAKTAPMLQEAIITQRNGRYVVPLRAEFKGQLRSIVHDQSSSGATLFVEPLAIVDLNNDWHSLRMEEQEEERRVLAALSDMVGEHNAALTLLVHTLALFDLSLACARYADDLHASEPVLQPWRSSRDGSHPGSTIRLLGARHPLLDPAQVVAIDIDLDDQTFGVVITGPNTGGKTVTLKTVGLMALMAQSGLHLPARSGSELSVFQKLFADIGDEQSIEQSLSTFSGHVRNIVRILRRAGAHSLVLLDELGAGTDPQEGAALARAILAELVRRRIPHLVATHYPELKLFAHATPGEVNASMEFDLATLRPTYRLTLGLPGRSNALAIASRLGMSPELIEEARREISPEELRADDLLNQIHRQRDLARRARERADSEEAEAQKLRRELRARYARIEDERLEILEQARREAEEKTRRLEDELEELRRDLNRAHQPLEALKPVRQKLESAHDRVVQITPRKPASADLTAAEASPIRPGEKVRLRSIGMDGIVTALGESEIEVQIGNLRISARPSDVFRKGDPAVADEPPSLTARVRRGGKQTLSGLPHATEPAPGPGRTTLVSAEKRGATPFHPSPGMEIDLRGQRVEEGLEALDRYIESAYLSGLPFVRVIHGKGTGKLRSYIREALSDSPHVEKWENALDNEGGEGVTIARLRTTA